MIKGKNLVLKPILKNICFELRKGRITSFIGQSGAGKTTLLKCIANLNSHYEGCIAIDGKDLKGLPSIERASSVGFVHQQFHLFPHLTVLQNCTYALKKVLGLQDEEASLRSLEILESLGMKEHASAYPNFLSGGQQQRAAIARALALRPKVLLFDEPTSALDPNSKQGLLAVLQNLKEMGITIALSTHDMPFIRQIMDCIYFLENGELVEEWIAGEECRNTPKINQFIQVL